MTAGEAEALRLARDDFVGNRVKAMMLRSYTYEVRLEQFRRYYDHGRILRQLLIELGCRPQALGWANMVDIADDLLVWGLSPE